MYHFIFVCQSSVVLTKFCIRKWKTLVNQLPPRTSVPGSGRHELMRKWKTRVGTISDVCIEEVEDTRHFYISYHLGRLYREVEDTRHFYISYHLGRLY